MFLEEVKALLDENPVLKAFLRPLGPYLTIKDLVELNINQAGELRLEIEENGRKVVNFIKDKSFDFKYLANLCHVIANGNGFFFDLEKQPRVSAELPGGHRFEAMIGKHSKQSIAIAIRLKRALKTQIEDFEVTGELKNTLIQLVEKGANMVVSGGTSSGKTTFLNTLIRYIPMDMRILTVEDTYELDVPHHDKINYIVSRNEENPAIGYGQMIDHLLRNRPDLIIAGEISVANAFPIIRLLNTGHSGFMCTVHANTPELALGLAIPQNIVLAGIAVPDIEKVLYKLIDVVIQLHRTKHGKRIVTEILFPKTKEKINLAV